MWVRYVPRVVTESGLPSWGSLGAVPDHHANRLLIIPNYVKISDGRGRSGSVHQGPKRSCPMRKATSPAHHVTVSERMPLPSGEVDHIRLSEGAPTARRQRRWATPADAPTATPTATSPTATPAGYHLLRHHLLRLSERASPTATPADAPLCENRKFGGETMAEVREMAESAVAGSGANS